MTLASIESPGRAAPSALSDLSAAPSDPSSRPDNGEFGQVMQELMQPSNSPSVDPVGPTMAANSALLTGLPGAWGGDLLKAVHLGPHMNVITSEATAPDEQSLEAFARSQGLDETAVQWLMGASPTAVVAAPPAAAPAISSMLSTATEGAAFVAAEGAAEGAAVGVAVKSPEAAMVDIAGATLATAAGAPVNAMSPPQGAPAAHPATTPASSAHPQGASGKPDPALAAIPLNAMALWAMSQSTEKAHAAPAAQENPSDLANTPIALVASSAPAAIWMLRNAQAVAPSKDLVAAPRGPALSEIDLTSAANPQLLDALSQAMAEGGVFDPPGAASEQPSPLSGHTGQRLEMAGAARSDGLKPDAGATMPDSSTLQRSESAQNLAEKMGQAVGQRILSEIEKGQWHLKLSLRPATLGHIEVEMRMRSGELDAVFTAPQALTRELLQEGLSKLKDTLSQMGMDVASMQVGDGQSQKRGGESTPREVSKSANANLDDSKSSSLAETAPPPRMKMGQDGWDVLV